MNIFSPYLGHEAEIGVYVKVMGTRGPPQTPEGKISAACLLKLGMSGSAAEEFRTQDSCSINTEISWLLQWNDR
jgi:hypothetical protein